MKNVIIREAEIKDASNLCVLKQQVWIAAYAIEGIRTEFSDYVLNQFTLKNTQDSILNKTEYTLIAEIDNHIIACLEIVYNAIHPVSSEIAPEITVLYVLERFCGKRIGELLLKQAISHLKSLKHRHTWLTVYHENERAINFYNKQGFKHDGSTYFEMDGNKYENKIMVLEIV